MTRCDNCVGYNSVTCLFSYATFYARYRSRYLFSGTIGGRGSRSGGSGGNGGDGGGGFVLRSPRGCPHRRLVSL